ncbi:MAG: NAD(P)H-dependent flavin oxidoreductase [Desulfurella sp.]|jgi:nitronate monooxygenase|uniref:NAD(P)H-dependent flavin oxidoreductase n=1 Tax=Desulfurella sp. TaxID=1962857 RepID=UPI0003E09050|nr:nitronate monooxygenase [Desulfurella sp.]AHF97489.1 nitronate monooxygenase [Desulfurella acetivorans A63]PMP91280.1 MAG: nitronate monooxygenase [Desulfurella sp.]HEX13827.1 nitronate monooxygenase [Desulfurella acetivorans]
MFETQFTKDFNVEYPIMQGGMMWISKKELVSAVSNAGGLGILSALSFETPELLANEIEQTKKLTTRPFGVNLTFLPTLKPVNYDAYIDAIVQSGVKIVETAGRNPADYIEKLKNNNVKIIHKCTSIRHAIKAQNIGCDYVSIDGFECAGHPGEDDVTSLILIPRAKDELNIPIIASGGFGDARGFVAALSLGACAVNMGTRFMMTKEAPVHENIKQALLNAKETDTVLVERSLKNTLRAFKNKHALKVLELENNKATLEELAPYLSGLNGKKMLEEGSIDNALLACGQVIGLINDIPTTKEVIVNIINQAKQIIEQQARLI